MAALHQLNIILPEDAMRMIESKVASGEYKDPSDVVLEGLSYLGGYDTELEHWLRSEIPARCKEADEHPEELLTLEDMRRAVSEEIEAISRER